MNNAAQLGISPAFEASVVEYCAREVKAGREMTKALMVEAMHVCIRRQYSMLDRPEVVRAVSDAVYDSVRAKGGAPAKRVIDDAVIASAPADARHLLSRHRTR